MSTLRNFYNISDDEVIYRIFDINWLIKVFESQKLTLRKPRLWDDPFENFMERVVIVDKKSNVQIELKSVFNKMFGQCWTWEEKENDAMWRMYARKKNGVRVKTIAGKLLKAVQNDSHKFVRSGVLIGKVDYMTKDQIFKMIKAKDFAARLLSKLTYGNASVETPEHLLLVKRTEFAHEKEVRILCNPSPVKYESVDEIEFNLDPCDLFDEIIIDPRIVTKSAVNKRIDKFKSFGFAKTIKQSALYKIGKVITLYGSVKL